MKILLVDDHVLFREGIASILNGQPDLMVVETAASVKEAISHATELQPDLILMDFTLPDGTGVDATRVILKNQPNCAIIFLTMHEDDERLFEAIRHGAMGYMLKNVPVSQLLSNIRGLERGEAAISPTMTTRLINKIADSKPFLTIRPSQGKNLTNRELEILRELDTGASNREIATRLVISERTVKNHVSNILSKLKLKNRREAARFARHQGLV